HADVEKPGLALRMHADMRLPVGGAARLDRVRRQAPERTSEPLLRFGHVLLVAPFVEQVFEARLLAVGAVAVIDENAQHRRGRFDALAWLEVDAGALVEVAVAGDAA